MCWIDDLLDFWFGDRGLSDAAEDDEGSGLLRVNNSPSPEDRIRHDSSASSLSPLPDPPEMFLRPELITTIRESDGAAVEEAERVLRR